MFEIYAFFVIFCYLVDFYLFLLLFFIKERGEEKRGEEKIGKEGKERMKEEGKENEKKEKKRELHGKEEVKDGKQYYLTRHTLNL